FWTRDRKAGAIFAVLGLAAAITFGALAPSGVTARFVFGESATSASLGIPGKAGAVVFGILGAAAGVALMIAAGRRLFSWLVSLSLVCLLLALLCDAMAAAPTGSQFLPISSLLAQSLDLAIPLIFGALAGALCERSGVINVAIEGQLLLGAFAAAMFS